MIQIKFHYGNEGQLELRQSKQSPLQVLGPKIHYGITTTFVRGRLKMFWMTTLIESCWLSKKADTLCRNFFDRIHTVDTALSSIRCEGRRPLFSSLLLFSSWKESPCLRLLFLLADKPKGSILMLAKLTLAASSSLSKLFLGKSRLNRCDDSYKGDERVCNELRLFFLYLMLRVLTDFFGTGFCCVCIESWLVRGIIP